MRRLKTEARENELVSSETIGSVKVLDSLDELLVEGLGVGSGVEVEVA